MVAHICHDPNGSCSSFRSLGENALHLCLCHNSGTMLDGVVQVRDDSALFVRSTKTSVAGRGGIAQILARIIARIS
jgi:hypothetical protein